MTRVNAKMKAIGAPQTIIGRDVPSVGDAAIPRYEFVKRHVSEAILLGHWTPGTVLPSETALARMFGVAVGTARRALSDLTAEGLLTRRRKTGTVVTGRSPHHSLRLFFQYFRLHGLDGALVRSRAKVLSVEIAPANEEEAGQLQIGPRADVVRIHRVRSLDGRPIMHDRMVLQAARLPGFPVRPADVPELIYLHLLERYGIRISTVREQLTADLADSEDQRLLRLKRPAAVLTIDEIAYDQSGAPAVKAWHRATTAAHCYINEVR